MKESLFNPIRAALLVTILFLSPGWAGVNLQLHRDFQQVNWTATNEFFGADGWGSTFWFLDLTFKEGGTQDAYYEISRQFHLIPVMDLTVQYNDGVQFGRTEIQPVWLGGIQFNQIDLKFLKVDVQTLLRKEKGSRPNAQLTVVWNRGMTPWMFFLGYFDLNGNDPEVYPEKLTLWAEPQLMFTRGSVSVGTEMRISRGFPGAYNYEKGKWSFSQTLYVRYDF
ncbi:DUF5020 family protein [candidate division KSB1 bacterium]|nr:DUF5020 family protein [candidate division KSB1 bacterium]